MRYLMMLALLGSSVASAEPTCTKGQVHLDSDGHRLEVAFQNHCESPVSCKIEWQLKCGHDARQARTDELRLDGHGESTLSLSAASCGDGDWEISPPRWRCDGPQIVDGNKPRRRQR